jgi:hypothetical protein
MEHDVRHATIHPLLANVTIGGLPLVVIAYTIAARRRSPAWTLVGDAALGLTALLTLGTLTFGLVSNAVVPWPGGIERWRWLHLGFGVATTVALLILAVWRLLMRLHHHDAPAGWSMLGGALVIGALAGFTGWIGGEVLVFHAGMAVRAAGDGALAPPVSDRPLNDKPSNFLDAMRQARAAWGSINGRLAWMLVQHPRDEDFARIAVDAERMQVVAGVMADEGAKDPTHGSMLASMAQTLAGDAADIVEAAHKKNLQDIAKAVGEASGHCADCHEEVRWK